MDNRDFIFVDYESARNHRSLPNDQTEECGIVNSCCECIIKSMILTAVVNIGIFIFSNS